MRVRELLTRDRTVHNVEGVSKKRLLDQVATLVADNCRGLSAQDVFDNLVARERLGSTGIGEGIAIPHCRLPVCDKPVGMLMHLADPIDFESIDGRPVDLVFVLLVPDNHPEQHLKTLSHLAALFSESSYRDRLRGSADADSLFEMATGSEEELQLAS